MSDTFATPPACDPTRWAAAGVRELQPYLPGKPISELEREYGVRDIIKLASNENPLGAHPAALEAMRAELPNLALYPEGGFALVQALARRHDTDPACITLGNGSNDNLVLLAETFLQPGAEAVYSQYCFAVYPIAVQATGATARVASANPAGHEQALGHDLDAMRKLINEHTRIVFIANPNNPTGNWLHANELLGFLEDVPADTIVVVDEAYHEYAAPLGLPDASGWLSRFPNLVVTRTFSKAYGMAGIRLGYSLSSPEVAGLLNRVRQPFNVNSLAMVGAGAALMDHSFIDQSVQVNSTGLAQLGKGLGELGVAYTPSAGNFLLVDMARPAGEVFEALLRRSIIVRPVANYGLDRHLRITVGTRDQNQRLLAALGEILESHQP
jgi:histidinol-phosphate aminotransferase